MNKIFYLGIIIIAFVISIGLTPIMMLLSRKFKILDIPDKRKSHHKPIPLLGGIGIYLATIITTILFITIFAQPLQINIIIAFLIGISGVTIMGLIDDIIILSAKRRLLILFILALIILLGCLQFYFPNNLLLNDVGLTLLVSSLVVLWIVAITNAINLSDGLDGLSSSLSLASIFGFALIFYIQGRTELALPTTLALFGAVAGFLPYNISPAKIFMGDAGSMFIGFMLGILSIMSISQKSPLFFAVPFFFILMPILDMSMSILRRLLLHKPVMSPDKMHIHHMLYKRFKNNHIVVAILTTCQLFFVAIGIVIYITELLFAGWIIMGIVAVGTVTYTVLKVRTIHYKEIIDVKKDSVEI